MNEIIRQAVQAIDGNQVMVLKEILDLGIDPNQSIGSNKTMLSLPEVFENTKLLSLLFEHGADPHLAKVKRHDEINQVIPFLRHPNGITNLMIAAIQPTSHKLVQYLAYARPEQINLMDNQGQTALMYAQLFQRTANVKLIQTALTQQPTGPKPDLLSPLLAKPSPVFHSKNFPLLEGILAGQEFPITPQMNLFERNYYGKTLVDAFKYLPPTPAVQSSLAQVFLNNLRQINGFSGPHLLEVITINHVPCFLIGESHEPFMRQEHPGSLPIEDFLRGLFTLSPVCVDFFLETYIIQHTPGNKMPVYNPIIRSPGHAPMMGLADEYFNCLGPQKYGCKKKYPHTRMHNIEIRRSRDRRYSIAENTGEGIGTFGLFNQYLNWTVMTPELKEYIRRLDRMYEIFVGFVDGDLDAISAGLLYLGQPIVPPDILTQTYGVAGLQTNSIYAKVGKQLASLPPKMQAQVKTGLINQYNTHAKDYIDGLHRLVKRGQMNELKQEFDGMARSYGSLIADVYAIARMLKTIFIYQTNFLVSYVGSGHTINYLNLLVSLGATIKYQPQMTFGTSWFDQQERTPGYIDLSGPQRKKWLQAVDLLEKAFNTPSPCHVNE